MKHIYFTVTNDLTYDQRMHRICTSLAGAGYKVTLVGRELKTSIPLQEKSYAQKRLTCIFNTGFLFYAAFNLRLFFFLLTKKMDAVCAIDLDTILPCLVVSKIKGIKRVYDAHEYFTQQKEVRTRPIVNKFWSFIERFAVPQFDLGYTVTEGIVDVFRKLYGRRYTAIRNLPFLEPLPEQVVKEKVLVYQGAVNEGRGFEYLIPAMQKIEYPLVICGDGNFMKQAKQLVEDYKVGHKVTFTGMILPGELKQIAQKATLGIGLADKIDVNQYYALANKFLDYMHAALPQIAMNNREYPRINEQYKIAVLLDELSVDGVAETVNGLMKNETLLRQMSDNARRAREIFNWQAEEKKLLHFYQQVFS